MPLLQDHIRRLATLAHLDLPPVEIARTTSELGVIVSYLDQIRAVDTASVQPFGGPAKSTKAVRRDNPRSSLAVDQALRNAPHTDGRFFLVPRVIER